MTFKFSLKADLVRSARKEWMDQYRPREIVTNAAILSTAAKLTLLPDDYTAEQFEAIVGNDSWTGHRCAECNADRPVLAMWQVGPDDWTILLCASCLQDVANSVAERSE